MYRFALVPIPVRPIVATVGVFALGIGSAMIVLAPFSDAAQVGPVGTVYVTDFTGDRIVPVPVGATAPGTPINLPAGSDPVGINVTGDAARAYVADSGTDQLTPVALSSQAAGVAIPVGTSPANPQYFAISPDDSHAYVANETSSTVTPIDLATNQPGTPFVLPAGSGPVAVAFTPDGATAFVANYQSGSVTPITVATRRIGTPISVGASPAALAVTPDGKTLYVVNQGANTVTPITVSTSKAGNPIHVGASPDGIAVSPDGRSAYVVNYDADSVTPIDLSGANPISGAQIGLGAGTRPSSVAIAPDGSTVYVSEFGSGGLAKISAATNTVSRTILVGGSPLGVSVTPDVGPVGKLVVTPAAAGSATGLDASSSVAGSSPIVDYHWTFGDGTTAETASPSLTHVYATAGSYRAKVRVTDQAGTSNSSVYTGQMTLRRGGAAAIAGATVRIVGPTSGAPPIVYVADSGASAVTPIATAPALSAGTAIAIHADPSRIAISANGATAYTVNPGDGTVTPIDVSTGLVRAAIQVGNDPTAIALTPDGTEAYVADEGDAALSVITLSTGAVRTVDLPGAVEPVALAIDPSGTWVYVADARGGGILGVNIATDAVSGESMIGGSGIPVALTTDPSGSTLYYAATGTDAVSGVGISAGGLGSVGATTSLGAGNDPSALAVSPNGGALYVTASGSGKFVTLNLPALSTASTLALGAGTSPAGIAISPDGSTAFVTEAGVKKVVPIALTGSAGPAITVGSVPQGIAVTPDQAPIAKLAATPALAASPSLFDAGASSAPSSAITSYTWNFGDGTPSTTSSAASTSHSYAKPGDYTATVTLTDLAGTSTSPVFTGQTMSRNGGRGAQAAQTFHVFAPAPTVTDLTPASGAYAQPVTITGTWLYGATVTFGGIAVPAGDVTVAADGQSLVALAPGGPVAGTPVAVELSTPGPAGPQAASAGSFTYTIGGPQPIVTGMVPTSARPGSLVEIVGNGLGGASVTFNGIAAPVTSNSGGAVVVTAPAGTLTARVVVTTQNGIVGAGTFTYTGGPHSPSITAMSPTSGVAGSKVLISGLNLYRTTGVFFNGQRGSVIKASETLETVIVPPGAGTAPVIITTVQGISGASTAESSLAGSFTYTTGTPAPTVATFGPLTGKAGQLVTITGANLTGAVVDFGGVPATVMKRSSTSITASAPTSIGRDTVTIITPGGRIAAGVFDYLPVVKSLSITGGNPGAKLTLNGTNLHGATAVEFGTAAATITADAPTAVSVLVPPGPAGSTVPVIVLTPGGASIPLSFTYAA